MPCQVVRFNPAAAWFIPNVMSYRLNTHMTAWLVRGEVEIGPLPAHIVSLEPEGHDGRLVIGVRFTHVPLKMGKTILALCDELMRSGAAELARSLSRVREEITDPSRIRQLIGALIAAGGRGVLRERDAPVRLESMTSEGEGRGTLTWAGPAEWGNPPFAVDLGGYNSIHRLHLPSVRVVEDGRAVTPASERVQRVRHRWFRRCEVQGPMSAAYVHPLWPELRIADRKVLDVCFGGMAFEVEPDDCIFPGLDVPAIVVEWSRGPPLKLHGTICYVLPAGEGRSGRAGVMIRPCRREDEGGWLQLVLQHLHGATEMGVTAPELLWSLLQISGYFNLSGKSPRHFEPLKQDFFDLARRAAAAPSLIGQVVWPSRRGIEASFSVTKVYEQTWMVHQLAKRPGRAPGVSHTRQILRDVYLRAFEHMQLDPEFRWATAYVDADVGWTMSAHVDFARRHADERVAAVVPFRLTEARCDERSGLPPDARLDVGQATPEEVALLLDAVTRARPAAYREALDLTPERIGLERVVRAWRDADMERDRAMIAARRDGRPVAVAIMESGETGANPFRLLDCARVFLLLDDVVSAVPRLLDEARLWYAGKGKSSFAYVDEREDLEHMAAWRLDDLGPGTFWVIASTLLPEFLEHIYVLTSLRRSKP